MGQEFERPVGDVEQHDQVGVAQIVVRFNLHQHVDLSVTERFHVACVVVIWRKSRLIFISLYFDSFEYLTNKTVMLGFRDVLEETVDGEGRSGALDHDQDEDCPRARQ